MTRASAIGPSSMPLPLPTIRRSLILLCLLLGLTSCTSLGPASVPTRDADDYAVVRAIADASYREGVVLMNEGRLEEALVVLNRASLNDPDSRQDIRQAIDEVVSRLRAQPAAPTRTPIPTRTPLPVQPTSVARDTPTPAPAAKDALPKDYEFWADSQGRFRIARPSAWQASVNPQAAFGAGIVAFREPGGVAELVVSVDEDAQVISPELYSARMEIAMQGVRGYALETVLPGITAGSPSHRRTFVLQQRDATGAFTQARGFQIVVIRGGTPYIVSASAPSATYERFGPVFDQIVETLSFR